MNKVKLSVILMSCVLVACASLSTKKRMERLDETMKMFEHALLRSDFMAATQYLKDPDAVPADGQDLNKNVKIVNFKPVRMAVSDDDHQVDRVVEVQFFYTDRNILKTTIYRQQWRYQDEDKRWLLMSGLPEFPQ